MKKLGTALLLAMLLLLLLSGVRRSSSQVVYGDQFRERLEMFANDALGISATQALYNRAVQPSTTNVDGNTIANSLASGVSEQLDRRLVLVTRLRETALEWYVSASGSTSTQTRCCRLSTSQLTYDSRFNRSVRLSSGCDWSSSSRSSYNEAILRTASSNLRRMPTIKFQYFGSEAGYTAVYPAFKPSSCTSFDPRTRPWYASAVVPTPKDIVIVLDVSSSSRITTKSVQAGLGRMLASLSAQDRVTIVPFSSSAIPIASGNLSCFNTQLGHASRYAISQLQYYIARLSRSGRPIYSIGIEAAFQRFSNSPTHPSGKVNRAILFLAFGEPSDLETTVLNTLRTQESKFNFSVAILTFSYALDSQSSANDLLYQMAQQDYDVRAQGVTVGFYRRATSTSQLSEYLAEYYLYLIQASTSTTIISSPYYDAFGTGVVITAASAVIAGTTAYPVLRGVVGIDIAMSDLFGDISYFSGDQLQYAFVITNDGLTLLHPLLKQPVDLSSDPRLLDITLLETDDEFRSQVYMQMRRRSTGSAMFLATRYLRTGDSRYEGTRSVMVNSSYHWRPIANTNFVVCVVLNLDLVYAVDPLTTQIRPYPRLATVYHRLDLQVSRGQNCSQFGHLALSDVSTVKFSPEAFINPSNYLNLVEDITDVRSYLRYFDGPDGNIYFKNGVRNSVRLTAGLDSIWRRVVSQSIVRRYIGTIGGTFRILPGTQLTKVYDHTRRDWFTRALNNAGELTLSSPYADFIGAGFIVTLSHSIVQSVDSSMVTAVGAVMGMDVTIGYLGQLLKQAYSVCQSEIRCLLIDQSGYLVYHPDFLTSSYSPVRVHLGFQEPYLMKALLEAGIAEKITCSRYNSFEQHTTYRISTNESYNAPRLCTSTSSFQLQPVNGTNVFIAFLSATRCSIHNNFVCNCPSRNGLHTCRYSSLSLSCECPCTSQLDFRPCGNNFSQPAMSDVCPAEVSGVSIAPKQPSSTVSRLTPCANVTCRLLSHTDNCSAAQGCSWCRLNSKSGTLSNPYCSTGCSCYGGAETRENPALYCPSPQNDTTTDGESSFPPGAIAGIIIISLFVVCFLSKQSKKDQQRPSAPRPAAQPAAQPASQPLAQPAAETPAQPTAAAAVAALGGSEAPPVYVADKPPDYEFALQLKGTGTD